MDVFVVFGTVAASCGLVGFLMREQLWEMAVSGVSNKARLIVRHELRQDHVLRQASTGLNSAVEKHVLNNPAVVRKTAELFRLLFAQARMQHLASDLMGKALEHPTVQNIMGRYVAICLDKRIDAMLEKEQMARVLAGLREDEAQK